MPAIIKWRYCWLGRSISKELLLTNTFASVSHTNSFSLFAGLFPEMTTAFILNAISTTQGPIFFRTFGAEGVTAMNTVGTLVLINHTSAIVAAHHLIASVWKKRYTGKSSDNHEYSKHSRAARHLHKQVSCSSLPGCNFAIKASDRTSSRYCSHENTGTRSVLLREEFEKKARTI